jgi:hypothetical protein
MAAEGTEKKRYQALRRAGGWLRRHKDMKRTADYADYTNLGIRVYKYMRICLWCAISNTVWA